MTRAVRARLPGGPDLPALLPGALLSEPARRTPRDWFVDTTLFVLASGLVALIMVSFRTSGDAAWVTTLDVTLGVLATVALWWRRRWPTAIALALVPVGLVSLTSAPAAIVMVFTVAIHRPVSVSTPIATAHAATTLGIYAWRPDPELSYWVSVVIGVLVTFAIFAWGMFVRARRQLILSLRDRAQRAEEEQQLRIAQARQLERARIAREMHDVLAHRISLLSLHAGALEFRTDVPPDEVSRAAGVIRASAHDALQDLRQVIGVLRDDGGGVDEPPRPQPTLADVPGLVEESRAAGMRIRLDPAVDDLRAVPESVGRNAYRIVQEGLTNARKHAAGAVVDVRISGTAGEGLTVSVRNPAPVGGRSPGIPGAGTGIVGLAERAALAGGRLEHGRTPTGDFELRAWLPWS